MASLINESDIDKYKWSSFSEYISPMGDRIANSDLVLSVVGSRGKYLKFVMDHVDYAKKLDTIKHLALE